MFRVGDVVRMVKNLDELSVILNYTGIITSNHDNGNPNKSIFKVRYEGTIHSLRLSNEALELELDPDRIIAAEELRHAQR